MLIEVKEFDVELLDGKQKRKLKVESWENSLHIKISGDLEIVVFVDGFNEMLHIEVQHFGSLVGQEDYSEIYALEDLG